MMGARYYQAPDGTGPIKHHPFCVAEMVDGEKVYTLDDDGNRIRSIRINKDGTPFTKPTNAHLGQRITKDDFLSRRRRLPTKKQAAALEEELKAQKDLMTAQMTSMGESVDHVHDENCDHSEEE